ncbi:hypothetical protein FACS189494_05030 [Spirochaetia bacterium]|nr:hypothetical protein FACS189494_05030 [Spirochaetia bacterium]
MCFVSIKFVILLPPVYGFILTSLFGLNTPVYDDWHTVLDFLGNVSKNGLSFNNLFAQNNDSRYLFPKLVWLLLEAPFHVNMKVYMYFEWCLITLAYLAVIFYVSREEKLKTEKQRIFLYLLLGFVFFNVFQWDADALLEAASVNWFLKHLFIVLGFLCFHCGYNRSKIKYFVCSGLSFIIASYSHLSGTFWLPVILIVFFLLLLSKEKIQKTWVLWTGISSAVIYPLYFYNYHKFDIHTDYHYAPISNTISYFFAGLGSPLIPRHFLPKATLIRALIIGLIVFIVSIVLIVHLIKHKRIQDNIFPICLIFYGFVFCTSTALGRVGFGVGSALTTRYVVNVLLTIIGIVLVVYNEILNSESAGPIAKNISKYGIFALFLLCFSVNTDWSIPQNVYNQRKNMQNILRDYHNQPLESLQTFFPWWGDLETARTTIEIAEKNGWSVFYKSQTLSNGAF